MSALPVAVWFRSRRIDRRPVFREIPPTGDDHVGHRNERAMFAVPGHSACRNDVVRSRPGNRIRRLFLHHILAISRNPGMAHWPRDRVDLVALSPSGGP